MALKGHTFDLKRAEGLPLASGAYVYIAKWSITDKE